MTTAVRPTATQAASTRKAALATGILFIVTFITSIPAQLMLYQPLLSDPVRRAELLAGLPIGRIGEPDDLVGVVRWLVSDASSFATGGFFPVDGGITAR